MNCCSRKPSLILASLLLAALCVSQAFTHGNEHHDAEAAAGHSHAASQIHGGEVVMTQEHHFEVSYTPTTLRVHVYDGHQKPLPAQGVTGEATITLRAGGAARVPLRHVAAVEGAADYLEGTYAFAPLKPGSAKVAIQLAGLSGKEGSVSFKATFAGVSKVQPAPHDHHDHGTAPHAH